MKEEGLGLKRESNKRKKTRERESLKRKEEKLDKNKREENNLKKILPKHY